MSYFAMLCPTHILFGPSVCFYPDPSHPEKTKKDKQRQDEQAGLECVRANLQAMSLDGCRRQSAVLISAKLFLKTIIVLFCIVHTLCRMVLVNMCALVTHFFFC